MCEFDNNIFPLEFQQSIPKASRGCLGGFFSGVLARPEVIPWCCLNVFWECLGDLGRLRTASQRAVGVLEISRLPPRAKGEFTKALPVASALWGNSTDLSP